MIRTFCTVLFVGACLLLVPVACGGGGGGGGPSPTNNTEVENPPEKIDPPSDNMKICANGNKIPEADECPPVPCQSGPSVSNGQTCPPVDCQSGPDVADGEVCAEVQCTDGPNVPDGQTCAMVRCRSSNTMVADGQLATCPRVICADDTSVADGEVCAVCLPGSVASTSATAAGCMTPCIDSGPVPNGQTCPPVDCQSGPDVADGEVCAEVQCTDGPNVPDGQTCAMVRCRSSNTMVADGRRVADCPRVPCEDSNSVADGETCARIICADGSSVADGEVCMKECADGSMVAEDATCMKECADGSMVPEDADCPENEESMLREIDATYMHEVPAGAFDHCTRQALTTMTTPNLAYCPGGLPPEGSDTFGPQIFQCRGINGLARLIDSLPDSRRRSRLRIIDDFTEGAHGNQVRLVADACSAIPVPMAALHDETDGRGMERALAAISQGLLEGDVNGGAWVINASLDEYLSVASQNTTSADLQDGGRCRLLLVVAAGNDVSRQNLPFGQDLSDAGATACALVVTGATVDQFGNVSRHLNAIGCNASAREGDATPIADRPCLAAFYEVNPLVGNNLSIVGTSVATPTVAASLAVVAAAWPVLTPENLRTLALIHCVTPGDPALGRGILSLSCLFEPVEMTLVDCPPGADCGPAGTANMLSGSVGVAGLGSFVLTAYDSLGRDFSLQPATGLSMAPWTGSGAMTAFWKPEETPWRLLASSTEEILDGKASLALEHRGEDVRLRFGADRLSRRHLQTPVSGDGSWRTNPVHAVWMEAERGVSLFDDRLRATALASCRHERMNGVAGSLTGDYRARLCGGRLALQADLSAAWRLTGTLAGETGRHGHVMLAGTRYDLDAASRWTARARIAVSW